MSISMVLLLYGRRSIQSSAHFFSTSKLSWEKKCHSFLLYPPIQYYCEKWDAYKEKKIDCIVSFLVGKKENRTVSNKVYCVIFVQIIKDLVSIATDMKQGIFAADWQFEVLFSLMYLQKDLKFITYRKTMFSSKYLIIPSL